MTGLQPGTGRGGRLGRASVLGLLAYGLTLLGIGLGSTRVLTFHEANFAQPAREMVHTGQWLLPRTVGVLNTHKPPLTTWAIAGAMKLFGSEAEWVCRLPGVLAAVAVALIVAALASRWSGPRVGLISGLVQLTCFYVLMQARLAEADMLLCLWVTVAMACFCVFNTDNKGSKRPYLAWIFFAALGLSFMTKFAVGPALILGACALYVMVSRQWSALRFFASPLGWAVLLAVSLPWPILAYLRAPEVLEAWRQHNLGRFAGQMGTGTGVGGWAFYLYMAPLLLLPWTPWAVYEVYAGIKTRTRPSRRTLLLGAWFLAGLAVLSLSAWKAKHYLIPAMPPLSILAARGLDRDVFQVCKGRKARLAVGLPAVGLAWLALVWWVNRSYPDFLVQWALLILIIGLLVCLALALGYLGKAMSVLCVLFAACWIAGVGGQIWVIRAFDSYRVQAEFAGRVNAMAPADREILILGLPEDQVIYYLRWPLARSDDPIQWAERASEGSEYFIVARLDAVEVLRPLGRVDLLVCSTPRKGGDLGVVFMKFGPGL